MTITGYDIRIAQEDMTDNGVEVFFDYYWSVERNKDPYTGVAAFYLNKKPNILKGEPYISYCYEFEGEQYVLNYGLYSYRMCLKYNIGQQFFISEWINTKDIINSLIEKTICQERSKKDLVFLGAKE